VIASAPASSANLGPGFDTLALALERYVEVEIEPSSKLIVRSEGEGAGLADNASHLAARVAVEVAGHDRLAITVRSEIPVARGMGSSAALAVAAAAAAGSPDPLGVAAGIDGHPDNAAASVVGGLTTACIIKGQVRVVRLPLDERLELVVLVPDRTLPTKSARQALPDQIDRADAIFNLGRMGMLLAGLADHRFLAKEATQDRLHQPYRTPLFPEAPDLLAALQAAGALATCWSGAGPSLLAMCGPGSAAAVQRAGEEALSSLGVGGHALALRPDHRGLVVGDEARRRAAERA
jgi:homoserine kinase